MKKLCTLFTLIFVFSLTISTNAFAQAKPTFNSDVTISFGNDVISFTLDSGIEMIKITPSGNFVRILTFQLDPDDPLLNLAMPFAIVKVSLKADTDGDGETDLSLKDERAVITPSGVVKLVYHLNGKKKE
ncbi:hypothetical protein [uncultured Draconibacterium sp.]|uniref:hypothetical protein n=1 Tax=uncultured Draconibacterium sp. TaxID=1573823 RepID=UPI0029C73323|nr:hypothetical protein [uncultured Draconibacterium sp.]